MPRRIALVVVAAAGAALVASDAPIAQDSVSRERAAAPLLVQEAKFGGRGLSRKTGGWFGTSVAVSRDGNTALIGAPGMNDKRGAAWIFIRRGQTWSSTRLAGTGQAGPARFGTTVALSENGKVALIGGPFDAGERGAAWVFERSTGEGWTGNRKLTGTDATLAARFGTSVALSANGRTALIGGPADGRYSKGAAWWFMRRGSRWEQTGAKLSGGGEFGTSVAVSDDASEILIGAPETKKGRGAAYFYTRDQWRGPTRAPEPTKFFGQPWFGKKLTAGGGAFGSSVALRGDALIGAPRDGGSKGAAWFYEVRAPGFGWPRQKLTGAGGRFGSSVALSFGVPLIGAPNDLNGKGAVWGVVGRFGNDLWARPVRLSVQSTIGRAAVGSSIASSGGFTLVGGLKDDSRGAGWLFVENPPVVTGVSPDAGPTDGGTQVTITGANFTCTPTVRGCSVVTVRRVFFGSMPATIGTRLNDRIPATSPPGQAGTVDVTVLTTRGRSRVTAADLFTYLNRPAVTGVSPSSGLTGGGTRVAISGADFTKVSAVTFGASAAASFTVDSPTRISATAPPGAAGSVDVTVTTPGGTSATSAADRFTYVAAFTQKVISFDDLTTGGPSGALVTVDSQYAGQGVTFNSVKAIDYSKGSAIAGFARSGTVGIEQCVGVEFCTTPLRATFSTPKLMVRVWVGFSFPLNQPLQVQLRALSGATVVGTSNATLPANASPTPIRTALEVQVGTASITSVEVSVPGGYNSALAVDDVTFEGP